MEYAMWRRNVTESILLVQKILFEIHQWFVVQLESMDSVILKKLVMGHHRVVLEIDSWEKRQFVVRGRLERFVMLQRNAVVDRQNVQLMDMLEEM